MKKWKTNKSVAKKSIDYTPPLLGHFGWRKCFIVTVIIITIDERGRQRAREFSYSYFYGYPLLASIHNSDFSSVHFG